MIPRPSYELPEEKQRAIARAIRLEWITIGLLISITVVMYLTMGASQAMRTAWLEDVLSLVPPISFLVAMRYRDRSPDRMYPYGYRRATLLAFMVAAVAVLVLGLYIFYESSRKLIEQHHPTLSHFDLFGWHIWSGWVMIAALVYSIIPPVILGRMKLPLGEELHEKTLHADAVMNKADWMTGAAATLGVLGIGIGWWWADAVAAGIIALNVIKDGMTHVKGSMADLMDRRPTDVKHQKPIDIDERVNRAAREVAGVIDADSRFREEGHIFSGELFVVLEPGIEAAPKLEEIARRVAAIDWRIHSVVVMPVTHLERSGG